MGKSKRQSKYQESEKSIENRKNCKKASCSNKYRKTNEKIKKAQKERLSKTDLIILLKDFPNFLGCFASDSLKNLSIQNFPVFLIVNFDISTQPGSHWVAIRFGKFTLEIFDSLGFYPKLWDNYPIHLFKFLSRYSLSHKFYFSPILQPGNTFTCGLFSVYFIVYRQKLSFSEFISKFYKNLSLNNSKLFYLLLNY